MKMKVFLISVLLMLCGCASLTPVEKKISSFETCRVELYTMDLSLDTTIHRLSGTVTMDIINETEDEINQLCIRQYASAYLEEFIDLFSVIDSAKLTDTNTALDIVLVDDTTYYLDLKDQPLSSNERIQIELSFYTDIPDALMRFGYTENSLGSIYQLSNCFPTLAMYQNGTWDTSPAVTLTGESNFNKVTQYNVHLNLPDDYMVVAVGNETVTEQGVDIEATDVREMAIVACDYLASQSTTTNDSIIVNHYYYDIENNEDYKAISLQSSLDAMELFTQSVGDYPYEEIDVVQTNISGGMEYPGLVMIGNYYDPEEIENFDESINLSNVCRVIGHEIGHQWFYSTIGSHPYNEAWLDEGLTSYLEYLYMRSNLPSVSDAKTIDESNGKRTYMNGYTEEEFETKILDQLSFVKELGFPLNNAFNQYICDYGNMYSMVVYNGSASFLYELKDLMGEEVFNQMLQDYYNSYYLKEATTKDFLNIVRSYDNSSKVNQWISKYINE